MGNMYTNRNSGLTVAMGKIKSIADDKLSMVIESTEYVQNPETKKSEAKAVDVKVRSAVPFAEAGYRVGYQATAVGYGRGVDGNTMQAQAVLVGADIYENEALAIVKGTVKKTFMNEEKNQDGTPKLSRDGKPRKRHFDITVAVKDEANNRWVDHVIKIYDGRVEPGKRGQIEQMQYRFKDFDAEHNRMAVTFVTQPAEVLSRTYVKNNGEPGTAYAAYHMGCVKMDWEYLGEKQQARENEQPAPAQNQSATAQNTSASAQTAPTQAAPTTPVQSASVAGNGFEAADITAPDMDEMELFN